MSTSKKTVIIGIVGSVLDSGFHEERWKRWRPLIAGRGGRVRHAEWGIDLLLRWWLLLRRSLGRWCLGKTGARCGYLKR